MHIILFQIDYFDHSKVRKKRYHTSLYYEQTINIKDQLYRQNPSNCDISERQRISVQPNGFGLENPHQVRYSDVLPLTVYTLRFFPRPMKLCNNIIQVAS